MATKDYGTPVRIAADQWHTLNIVAESLTRVRDDFYRSRGQIPPERQATRKDALRESIWLAGQVARGAIVAVEVEELKTGEVLKGPGPLADFIHRHTAHTVLAYEKALGHEVRVDRKPDGSVDYEVDNVPLDIEHLEKEAMASMEKSVGEVR